jgi:hypothetical protein
LCAGPPPDLARRILGQTQLLAQLLEEDVRAVGLRALRLVDVVLRGKARAAEDRSEVEDAQLDRLLLLFLALVQEDRLGRRLGDPPVLEKHAETSIRPRKRDRSRRQSSSFPSEWASTRRLEYSAG